MRYFFILWSLFSFSSKEEARSLNHAIKNLDANEKSELTCRIQQALEKERLIKTFKEENEAHFSAIQARIEAILRHIFQTIHKIGGEEDELIEYNEKDADELMHLLHQTGYFPNFLEDVLNTINQPIFTDFFEALIGSEFDYQYGAYPEVAVGDKKQETALGKMRVKVSKGEEITARPDPIFYFYATEFYAFSLIMDHVLGPDVSGVEYQRMICLWEQIFSYLLDREHVGVDVISFASLFKNYFDLKNSQFSISDSIAQEISRPNMDYICSPWMNRILNYYFSFDKYLNGFKNPNYLYLSQNTYSLVRYINERYIQGDSDIFGRRDMLLHAINEYYHPKEVELNFDEPKKIKEVTKKKKKKTRNKKPKNNQNKKTQVKPPVTNAVFQQPVVKGPFVKPKAGKKIKKNNQKYTLVPKQEIQNNIEIKIKEVDSLKKQIFSELDELNLNKSEEKKPNYDPRLGVWKENWDYIAALQSNINTLMEQLVEKYGDNWREKLEETSQEAIETMLEEHKSRYDIMFQLQYQKLLLEHALKQFSLRKEE